MLKFLFIIFATNALAQNLIIKNAVILTLDESQPWAKSLLIKNGKIVAISNTLDLTKPDNSFKELDLHQQFVMPSFHDNHIHPVDSGVEIFDCNLYQSKNLNELAHQLTECEKKLTSDKEWLRGSGWSSELFNNSKNSPKSLLDNLNLTHPVVLTSMDGHSLWLNSLALKIAGISNLTPHVVDGSLGRDENGQLNGILFEGAMNLIDNALPERNFLQQKQGLVFAINVMHRFGITSFKDAYVTEDQLKVYQAVEREGKLKANVALSLYADSALGLQQIPKLLHLKNKYQTKKIHINTVKIFLDGVYEDGTAAISMPYFSPYKIGKILWDKKVLFDFVRAMDFLKFQIHFHAIGDVAVSYALDAIDYAQRENNSKKYRHEIAHLQFVKDSDWDRFQKLGVSAVFSPLWIQKESFLEKYLAPMPEHWRYPLAAMNNKKAPLAFGSDWSVTSMNPWEGIKLASELIGLKTAIKAYTQDGAKAVFREDQSGSLSIGKEADFIVLDKNPFAISQKVLSTIQVQKTFTKGVRVFP